MAHLVRAIAIVDIWYRVPRLNRVSRLLCSRSVECCVAMHHHARRYTFPDAVSWSIYRAALYQLLFTDQTYCTSQLLQLSPIETLLIIMSMSFVLLSKYFRTKYRTTAIFDRLLTVTFITILILTAYFLTNRFIQNRQKTDLNGPRAHNNMLSCSNLDFYENNGKLHKSLATKTHNFHERLAKTSFK